MELFLAAAAAAAVRPNARLVAVSDCCDDSASGGHPGGGGGASDDRKKRPRTAFTAAQIKALEAEFEKNKYLSVSKRMQLSKQLKLTETQVSVTRTNSLPPSQETRGLASRSRFGSKIDAPSGRGSTPTNWSCWRSSTTPTWGSSGRGQCSSGIDSGETT